MPTFSFSDNELGKLVRSSRRFLGSRFLYVPEPVPVLNTKETEMARSLFSSPAAPCLKCHATGDPAHDRTATAPNFLQAKGRLKADWVERWIIDPQAISPGTSMPSGLFKREKRSVGFSGPTPASFPRLRQRSHQLLVDYILALTPEEQRRVSAGLARTPRKPTVGATVTQAPGGAGHGAQR